MSDPKTQDTTVYPKRKYEKKKFKNIKWMPLLMDVKTETANIHEKSKDYNEKESFKISIIKHIEITDDVDFEESSKRVSVNLDASKGFSNVHEKLVVKDKPMVIVEEVEDGFIILNHDDVFIKQEAAANIDTINIDTVITEQQSLDKQTQDNLSSNNVEENESSNSDDSESFTSYETSYSDYESSADDSYYDKKKIRKKDRKIYTCVECRFTGVYRDYQIHIQECSLKGRNKKSAKKPSKSDETWLEYHCSTCKTTFSRMRQYLHHFTLKHDLDHAVCPKCGEKTKNLTALESHIMWHVKQAFELQKVIKIGYSILRQELWLLFCKGCMREMKDDDDLFSHWLTHLKFKMNVSEYKVLKETVRARLRNKYKALSKEMVNLVLAELTWSTSGTKLAKLRTCVACKRQFNSHNDCKRHLVEHLLATHEAVSPRPRVRTFTCQLRYCKHKEDTLDRYREHLRAHARLPHYKCEMCDRPFSHSSDFIKHVKMHKAACRICGKKCPTETLLRRHVEMHFTTKPVTCCGGHFSFQSQLKRHIRSKHEM